MSTYFQGVETHSCFFFQYDKKLQGMEICSMIWKHQEKTDRAWFSLDGLGWQEKLFESLRSRMFFQ